MPAQLYMEAYLELFWVYSCAQNTNVLPGKLLNFFSEFHICCGVPSNSLPQPIAAGGNLIRSSPNQEVADMQKLCNQVGMHAI